MRIGRLLVSGGLEDTAAIANGFVAASVNDGSALSSMLSTWGEGGVTFCENKVWLCPTVQQEWSELCEPDESGTGGE